MKVRVPESLPALQPASPAAALQEAAARFQREIFRRMGPAPGTASADPCVAAHSLAAAAADDPAAPGAGEAALPPRFRAASLPEGPPAAVPVALLPAAGPARPAGPPAQAGRRTEAPPDRAPAGRRAPASSERPPAQAPGLPPTVGATGPAAGWAPWTGQLVAWIHHRCAGEAWPTGPLHLRLPLQPEVLPDSLLCLTIGPRRLALQFEVGAASTLERLRRDLPGLHHRLVAVLAEGTSLELRAVLGQPSGGPK